MKTMKTIATLATVALTALAHAEPKTTKMPVMASCSTQAGDNVGERVCTALRDRIAASPRYYLVDTSKGFAKDALVYRLALITLSDDNQPVATTDSASVLGTTMLLTTGDPDTPYIYMNSTVNICGSNKVAWCADSIFSSFDAEVKK
jgi:hypothetical protein